MRMCRELPLQISLNVFKLKQLTRSCNVIQFWLFLSDIESFIKDGNFGSKTMPLLKQRTCFLGNKLHRKSYYQCDGICAV